MGTELARYEWWSPILAYPLRASSIQVYITISVTKYHRELPSIILQLCLTGLKLDLDPNKFTFPPIHSFYVQVTRVNELVLLTSLNCWISKWFDKWLDLSSDTFSTHVALNKTIPPLQSSRISYNVAYICKTNVGELSTVLVKCPLPPPNQ